MTYRGSPMSPARTIPAALWLWGANRRLKQTALTSPLAAASSARAAVSAAVTPSGFSQTTWRPARRAAAAWVGVDVVGAGDMHGGQRVVGDQGLDRVVGGGQPEPAGHLPGPGRGAAGDPGDLDPEPPQGLGVGLGHPAGADDPDPDAGDLAHLRPPAGP